MNSLLKLENVSSKSAEKLEMFVDNVMMLVRTLKVINTEMNKYNEILFMNIIL